MQVFTVHINLPIPYCIREQLMASILIVEDEVNIRKLVSVNLVKRGYQVFEAVDGTEAMSLFRKQAIDLVLLDILLPGMSGVDLCAWIRARSDVPIIILSGLRDEDLKVNALDVGADDYITKPFGHDELLARVNAMLRRRMMSSPEETSGKLLIDGLSIDLDSRRVHAGDGEVSLTKIEYALLVELASHPDAVIGHQTLLAQVWGSQYQGADHYLHIYLGRLRKKLGQHGELLETVSGVGYRLLRQRKPVQH
jgi:two-component system KDP operon response regulator KdpE